MKLLGISPTIDDIASGLLDDVVDKEAELLANGLAKFGSEQVVQSQVMARRDLVLIASYIRSNTIASIESASLLKLQNILLVGLIVSVLFIGMSLWLTK